MMIVWFTIFLVLFSILCKKFIHCEFANDKNVIVNVWNFFGWLHKLSKSTNENRISLYDEFGRMFPKYARLKIFGYDVFLTHDPEMFRKIFLSQQGCGRSLTHLFQMPLSILTAEYPEWKKARKEINPAFSTNVLRNFLPVFEEQTDSLVTMMEEKYLDGKEFDVCEPIIELVYNTSAITIFSLHDKFDVALKMAEPIDTLMKLMMERLINPLMQNEFIFKWFYPASSKKFNEIRDSVYKMSDDALKESMRIRKAEKCDENENIGIKRVRVEYLIDILINNGSFNEEEIKQQIGFMMVATSDTSITFLTACITYLAIHQNYQDKVYEEIISIFNDDNVEVNPENLTKLTFLKQCMDESLRLFSPVPHILRKVAFGQFDLGLKSEFEKDTQIHVMPYLAHMNKEIWGDDVREFKPERFSPENCEKRHPYAFAPFGHGPRMCIGYKYAILSTKIELMKLFKAFKFRTNLQMKDIKMSHIISAKFTQNPKVWIEKRS